MSNNDLMSPDPNASRAPRKRKGLLWLRIFLLTWVAFILAFILNMCDQGDKHPTPQPDVDWGERGPHGLPRFSAGHARSLPGVGLGHRRRVDAALRCCGRRRTTAAIRGGLHALRRVLRPELECRHDDHGLRRVWRGAERPVDDDRSASLPPAHLRVPRVSLNRHAPRDWPTPRR